MTTVADTAETISLPAVIDFSLADSAIDQWRNEFLVLTVTDVNDKEGLATVHEARMLVKNKRVEIEKKRKSLVEKAVKYQREVNAEAKRLTSLLTPIEDHLAKEEQIVEREKERVRQEAESHRQSTIRARLELLAGLTTPGSPQYLASDVDPHTMTPQDWESLLASRRLARLNHDQQEAARKAEQERIAAEQKAESERLAAERAELDRQREQQAAEQRRIEDEKAEAAKKLREARATVLLPYAYPGIVYPAALETLTAQQFNDVLREAIVGKELYDGEQQREAEEQARREAEQAELDLRRIEALKPDHEKLMGVADLVDAVNVPTVSDAAAEASIAVHHVLASASARIREIATKLVS